MSHESTQTGSGWASGRVLSVGTRLAERYRIERFIASGGMGEVYEATDEALGERVALKVLTSHSTALEEEVRLARRVTHVNVCRVFDLGVHSLDGVELRFLTMELIRGEPLSAVLRRRGRIPASEVKKLICGVCEALAAARASGVVHGDLKPANVLITDTGRMVVTDFGLARGIETSAPARHGTPAYVSPEQVEGLPLTPASDVYALGVMVFELLTGEPPFKAGSARELSEQRLYAAPDVARLPIEFREEVAACLSLDPRGRPDRPSFARPRSSRVGWVAPVAVAVALVAAGTFALSRRTNAFVPTALALQLEVVPRDEWLTKAATGLLARELERTHWLKIEATGTPLVITLTREDDRVRVEASLAGSHRTVVAQSVLEAFVALAPSLLEALGLSGDAPAQASELEVMKRLGASDLLAFRAFRDGDAYWQAVEVDTEAVASRLEEGVARDPGWARIWSKLVTVNGTTGERGRRTLERARASVVRGVDPTGDFLLEALDLELRGDSVRAIELLTPLQPEWGDDPLIGWTLQTTFLRSGRRDEALATSRALYLLRPDLQFGGAAVSELADFGRESEIPGLLKDWMEKSPENEQAMIAAAHLEALAGDPHAAEWVDRLLLLYGPSPGRLFPVSQVYLALGRFTDARRAATALSPSGARASSFAQFLFGTMSIYEGRLGNARESLLPALEQGRPFGLESLTTQILFSLARLDRLAGRTEQEQANLLDLAATLRGLGEVSLATGIDAEAAMPRTPGDCASITRALEVMTSPSVDLTGRRYLTRVAARYGCADCASVLKEGSGLREPSTEGLLTYGKCAAELGHLKPARRALERASRMLTLSGSRAELDSPVDAVLARYYLAALAAREGKADEALKGYREFLARWSDTEVTVPELELARAEVVRLTR